MATNEDKTNAQATENADLKAQLAAAQAQLKASDDKAKADKAEADALLAEAKERAAEAEGALNSAREQAEQAYITGLRSPDGERKPGKLVKAGDLVAPKNGTSMVDSLTLKPYPVGSWTEAEPSTWLDGQVRAGKMSHKAVG